MNSKRRFDLDVIGAVSCRPASLSNRFAFSRKEKVMGTQFIYYSEETKFRIISTVLIAAIIAMVIITGLDYDRVFEPVDPERGTMADYPTDKEFHSEHRASFDRDYFANARGNESALDAEKNRIFYGE
jgi:hypothetical protein